MNDKSKPPKGWGVAGNYGDGKWRVIRLHRPQTYLGTPQETLEDAIAECWKLAEKFHDLP